MIFLQASPQDFHLLHAYTKPVNTAPDDASLGKDFSKSPCRAVPWDKQRPGTEWMGVALWRATWESCEQKIGHELASCPCSPENQSGPGLHERQRGQVPREVVLPLCSAPGPTENNTQLPGPRHRRTETWPRGDHGNGQRAGTFLL